MLKINYNQEIINKIVKARELLGINQKELAKLAELSTNKIKRIEEGLEKITIDDLVKLSKALKKDIIYFLPITYLNKEEDTLNFYRRKLESLNKDFRETVYHLIERLLEIQKNTIEQGLELEKKD